MGRGRGLFFLYRGARPISATERLVVSMMSALLVSLVVTESVEGHGTKLVLKRFLTNLFVEVTMRFEMSLVVFFCWLVDVANFTGLRAGGVYSEVFNRFALFLCWRTR